ncbi:MAG TPA: PH domain-containing protein [Candidatus Saccharimonadales bacterium]|jgi:hypothetical protein|nr:PH domain-containing protein [Candidatus Saccharimonadales bacterium]
MISLNSVEQQLKDAGCNFHIWWRPEVKELSTILTPEERIVHCTNGRYEGGWALLCVTDQRILLVDRKPMFLTLEDVRFDMIAEIDYGHRLLNAMIHIVTPNRTMHFMSWNQKALRELMSYTQMRVMQFRQQYMIQQQYQQQEQQRSLPAAQVIEQAAPESATAAVSVSDADMARGIGGVAFGGGGSQTETNGLLPRFGRPFNPYAGGLVSRRRFSKYYPTAGTSFSN